MSTEKAPAQTAGALFFGLGRVRACFVKQLILND
jgi:hypothetical protein